MLCHIVDCTMASQTVCDMGQWSAWERQGRGRQIGGVVCFGVFGVCWRQYSGPEIVLAHMLVACKWYTCIEHAKLYGKMYACVLQHVPVRVLSSRVN